MLLKEDDGQVLLSLDRPCVLENKGEARRVCCWTSAASCTAACRSWSPVTVRRRKPVPAAGSLRRVGQRGHERLGDEKNATNDHAVRDQTCLVPWLGTHEIGNTGFRFVRIDLVEPNSLRSQSSPSARSSSTAICPTWAPSAAATSG